MAENPFRAFLAEMVVEGAEVIEIEKGEGDRVLRTSGECHRPLARVEERGTNE